jgi:hypothetical protein
VVERIVTPYGARVEERPAVMTREERERERREKKGPVRMGKLKRKILKRVKEELKRE